jgi:hypothetical protein
MPGSESSTAGVLHTARRSSARRLVGSSARRLVGSSARRLVGSSARRLGCGFYATVWQKYHRGWGPQSHGGRWRWLAALSPRRIFTKSVNLMLGCPPTNPEKANEQVQKTNVLRTRSGGPEAWKLPAIMDDGPVHKGVKTAVPYHLHTRYRPPGGDPVCQAVGPGPPKSPPLTPHKCQPTPLTPIPTCASLPIEPFPLRGSPLSLVCSSVDYPLPHKGGGFSLSGHRAPPAVQVSTCNRESLDGRQDHGEPGETACGLADGPPPVPARGL